MTDLHRVVDDAKKTAEKKQMHHDAELQKVERKVARSSIDWGLGMAWAIIGDRAGWTKPVDPMAPTHSHQWGRPIEPSAFLSRHWPPRSACRGCVVANGGPWQWGQGESSSTELMGKKKQLKRVNSTMPALTDAHMHARTHARARARTHSLMHTRTHTRI